MSPVSVITDSSACLSSDWLDGLDVRVLPIVIHLPSGDVRDGMEGAEAAYEALARREPVKSSAPSPVEYLSAIEAVDPDADVIIITPATEFTVMHRNAALAAELAGRPVIVMDSRTAAGAHGLVVLAAAEAGRRGATAAEVVRVAEETCRRVELVAALDGVEHIRNSGRVPPLALELAHQLGIRPVFRLHGGTVDRLGVPRSVAAALRRIRREALRRGFAGAERSMVFHAAAPHRAAELRAMLGSADLMAEFSPSMGIHTGPGVVGVAWVRPA